MKILCRISELVNSEELKSGDYVSYKYDAAIYVAKPNMTGHNAEQRFESDKEINWRVLNVNDKAITIVPDKVPNELVLRGIVGALRGTNTLDSAMRELYSYPKANLFARSINAEDVNEFEKCTETFKKYRAFMLKVPTSVEYERKHHDVGTLGNVPATLEYKGQHYDVFLPNPNSQYIRADGGGVASKDKLEGIEIRKLAVDKPVYITYVYYKNESAKGIWLKDNAYWLATSLNRFDIPDTYYKLPYVNCSIISEATLFISCGINNSMCLGVCPIVTIPGNMMIDCTKRINHGQSPENAWRLIEKMV